MDVKMDDLGEERNLPTAKPLKSYRGKNVSKVDTGSSVKKEAHPPKLRLDVDGIPPLVGEDKVVSLTEVKPNPWNYNEQSDFMFEKLKLSIKKFGFIDSITVRSSNENGPLGHYEIIGGEHRHKAANELHINKVPIKDVGMMTDADLQQLMIVLNETKGRPNNDQLATIIADLDKAGIALDVLPYDKTELESLINMGEFNWDEMQEGIKVNQGSVVAEAADAEGPGYETLDQVLTWDTVTPDMEELIAKRYKKFTYAAKVSKVNAWKGLLTLLDTWYAYNKTKELSDIEFFGEEPVADKVELPE